LTIRRSEGRDEKIFEVRGKKWDGRRRREERGLRVKREK